MKTFETVKDVLGNARELHHLAGNLYRQLQGEIKDERAKILLGYMAEHEDKMEDNMVRYESHASQSILMTWMQYTLEETPQRFIDALDVSSTMNVGAVTDLGYKVDSYLVNVFDEITQTAVTNDLRDVFQSLRSMEEEEKHALTRAANSLWEL